MEVSAEQRLKMYVVNGSDDRCIVSPFNSRCPLFRASVKGGSTVLRISCLARKPYGMSVKYAVFSATSNFF